MNVLVSLFNSLPGAAGQGLIWGIMAIGVYITYKILDVADLTVDGSLATGGAVAALCVSMGWNPWLAVLAACCLPCTWAGGRVCLARWRWCWRCSSAGGSGLRRAGMLRRRSAIPAGTHDPRRHGWPRLR